MYYIVYPPWSISDDPAGQTFATSALLPNAEGKFFAFDWDILLDLTARHLIADHHTHPRWLGPMRRHRYPLYTPHPLFVRNAASYTSNRSIAIPVRQIMIAMQLNIHHTHIPKTSLVSSCYEHWCVDINHIAPYRALPSSNWSIDYSDPASGRPDTQVPVWQERELEHLAKKAIADDKMRLAAKSIGMDPKLFGLPEKLDEDESV